MTNVEKLLRLVADEDGGPLMVDDLYARSKLTKRQFDNALEEAAGRLEVFGVGGNWFVRGPSNHIPLPG